jgi:hypothetical protein
MTELVTGAFFDFNGLAAATTYEVRLRTTCESGLNSDYITGSFTTLQDPNLTCSLAIQDLRIHPTAQSAVVTWKPFSNAISFQLRWRPLGGTWTFTTVPDGANSFTINGLTAGVSYELRFRLTCPNETATWSADAIMFTTPNARVSASTTELGSIALYPNPSNGQFTVNINSITDATAVITVIDAQGRQVLNQTEKLDKGNNAVAVHLKDATTGIYMLKVQSSSGLVYHTKVLITQ